MHHPSSGPSTSGSNGNHASLCPKHSLGSERDLSVHEMEVNTCKLHPNRKLQEQMTAASTVNAVSVSAEQDQGALDAEKERLAEERRKLEEDQQRLREELDMLKEERYAIVTVDRSVAVPMHAGISVNHDLNNHSLNIERIKLFNQRNERAVCVFQCLIISSASFAACLIVLVAVVHLDLINFMRFPSAP